jgi:hypothetical protein
LFEGFQFIRAILQQSSTTASRSTALNPLMLMTGVLGSATLTSFLLQAPTWASIVFATFTGLPILLFLVAYIFFMIRDPDALRSERYSIQKMAIEKGLIGDDLHGLLEPTEGATPPSLPAAADES